MPSDSKKSRKLRGHVSHGHGRVGKHRKHPGGRGKAGGQHHHRIMFNKYSPDYFGKSGMKVFKKNKKVRRLVCLNVQNINSKKSSSDQFSDSKIINVSNLGYQKVIGKGKTFLEPNIIKANYFSLKAEKKINKGGGFCVLIS